MPSLRHWSFTGCSLAAATAVLLSCSSEPVSPMPEPELDLKDGVSREDPLLLANRRRGLPADGLASVTTGVTCTIRHGAPGQVEGCDNPVPTVAPVFPWLRQSGGLHEPEQRQPIDITFATPVHGITMVSQGAAQMRGCEHRKDGGIPQRSANRDCEQFA